ncbi:hypothetical protein NMY22_g7929 [Coprinellus aureogranulatus]|nr:hypothetical protein NMY22_g7929 [Coprinellus aureogranulatus]
MIVMTRVDLRVPGSGSTVALYLPTFSRTNVQTLLRVFRLFALIFVIGSPVELGTILGSLIQRANSAPREYSLRFPSPPAMAPNCKYPVKARTRVPVRVKVRPRGPVDAIPRKRTRAPLPETRTCAPARKPTMPLFKQTTSYTCYEDFRRDDEAWGEALKKWEKDVERWRMVHGCSGDERDPGESDESETESDTGNEGETFCPGAAKTTHKYQPPPLEEKEIVGVIKWVLAQAHEAIPAGSSSLRTKTTVWESTLVGDSETPSSIPPTLQRTNNVTRTVSTPVFSPEKSKVQNYCLRRRAVLKPTEKAQKIYRTY